MKKNIRIIVFVSVQLAIVLAIIFLVLFAGKKYYTVTFDLNGGTLISGNLVQSVRYGQSANPPEVTKDGAYFSEWDKPYNHITKNIEISAVWEYDTSAGIDFEYKENSNYCLISGCYNQISGDIYIGSYYEGRRVLGIKDGAFKDCENITGVYMLDGIISIGNEAFSGCTNLETIVIPSTVETVGRDILKDCNSLENLSISFIGNNAFHNKEHYLGYLFGASSFEESGNMVPSTLTNVTITSDFDILEKTFYNCSNIQEVIIDGDIEKIEDNAFRNCCSLTKIVFPNTLKEIGSKAFADCVLIEDIDLPNSIKKIEDYTFANCIGLNSFYIGENIEEISLNAFQNCINLKSFSVHRNNQYFKEKQDMLYILLDEKEELYIIIDEEYKDELSNSPII